VCVYVSQSGETADTILAMRYCLERGALCVGVVNVVGSTISRESHCGIHVNAGPEIGVASTKAYTSQYIALLMMAIQLAEDRTSMTARRNSIIDGLHDLPGQIRAILQHDSEFQSLAPMLAKQTSLLIMGRGYQYATCLEAALKIKELCYVAAEGLLAGELKHGPLALIDEQMPVILVMTQDSIYPKVRPAFARAAAQVADARPFLPSSSSRSARLSSRSSRAAASPSSSPTTPTAASTTPSAPHLGLSWKRPVRRAGGPPSPS